LGCAVQALPRCQDGARGPLGLVLARRLIPGPGGGCLSTRSARRDRGGRAPCVAAKFRRGVSGRSAAGFLPAKARRLVAFL
jgi:hypothetical protein